MPMTKRKLLERWRCSRERASARGLVTDDASDTLYSFDSSSVRARDGSEECFRFIEDYNQAVPVGF